MIVTVEEWMSMAFVMMWGDQWILHNKNSHDKENDKLLN